MTPKTKDRLLFLLGVAICLAVAAVSVLLEEVIPGGLLGASIIALFMGTILNSFFHPKWIKPALKFTSGKILKAAIAPVIDADDKDIVFAMSSIFLFDMVMIAPYPFMGKTPGMSDIAYGIWAGTSVNDTASVVASGLVLIWCMGLM